MRSVKSVLLLAISLVACSNPVAPPTIDGGWAQVFSIPGNSTRIQLTADAGEISGSGGWCGEAGPCGSISVAGTIRGTAVHLDLTFTTTSTLGAGDTYVQHFDGRVTPTTLWGTITVERAGQPPFTSDVVYRRQSTFGLTPF